jgi:alginate O-acetyltransferase complex protein AlgI
MRKFLFPLITFSAIIIFMLVTQFTHPISHTPNEKQVSSNSSKLQLTIPKQYDNATVKLAFTIQADNPRLMLGKKFIDLKESKKTTKNINCKNDSNKLNCQLLINTSKSDNHLRFASASSGILLDNISFKTLKESHAIYYSQTFIYALIAALIFILIINTLFYRHRAHLQWLYIALAACALFLLQPVYAIIILAMLVSIYYLGINVHENKRRGYVTLFVVLGALLVLFITKYGHSPIFHLFAALQDPLILPLGISYFVIRIIDTMLRWHRGELTEYSLKQFLFFVLFPGTLLAGPIETLDNFYKNQVEKLTRHDFAYGIARIFLGLFKKIVLAAYFLSMMQRHYSDIAALPLDLIHSSQVWEVLFGSLFYAYFDFAGYSDIAIGFSRLMGFRIIENFIFPIFAKNLQDFWRRWHRSLSMWSFRNVFFPLVLRWRTPYFPMLLTMITIGLWHNLSLSWLTWGLLQGGGLCFLTWKEHAKQGKPKKSNHIIISSAYRVIATVITLSFVALTHSFVLYGDYGTALKVFLAAFHIG